MTDALTSESNAACFFDHQGIVHYEFAPEVQIVNQDFYQAVLRSLWMCYEESDLKCGLRKAGSSIMTMRLFTQCCQLDNSWQNTQFLSLHNPPIHLISPLLTFFYSLNSKLPLKEEDMRQWKASSLMQ
jgi:hypothetical protein